ncbi:MAG: hypothetical protein ABFS28_01690 [Bacteroidota bacterium]
MLLSSCFLAGGQSMIGRQKDDVRAIINENYREFKRDNSVIRQQFNYLKFVNTDKTRTWILYFTDEDICKSSKLICDYSEFDRVVERLSSSHVKAGDSEWEYVSRQDTIQVSLSKQEWYFTVRETRKK